MTRPAFIAELLEAAGRLAEAQNFANDCLAVEYGYACDKMSDAHTALSELIKSDPANIIELAGYIEELEAGREAARNEALEEAAKEADRDIDENGSVMIRPYHEIAEAIRALKSKENEHE